MTHDPRDRRAKTTGPERVADAPPRARVAARLSGDRLRLVLLVIAILTVVSGLTQVVAPSFVLGLLSASTRKADRQLFATIGMFMTLFGGVLIHALLDRGDHPIIVLWASLQKFGASLAVVVGVGRDVFSPLALTVAGFDLISGVLGLIFWKRIRR